MEKSPRMSVPVFSFLLNTVTGRYAWKRELVNVSSYS